ncbi:MAG: 6-phosphogluconolactonase [Myxococcota bacterium]
MKPTLHKADGDLADVAGPLFVSAILETIEQTGRCRVGLSGGSTPASTMRHLAARLPMATYQKLLITFVDERAVMPNHADANYRLADTHWFSQVDAAPRVLPMYTGGGLADARAQFSRRFAADFDSGLDVVLLGVGGDGHIGSLFPGRPQLDSDRLCETITDSPKPPPQRLTLTLPVISASRFIAVLARGEGKAAPLGAVWGGDVALPLGRLTPSGQYHWIVDAAAAANLPEGEFSTENRLENQ